MHANFFTEVSNLGTKGQSIGVTCRAVALRGGGFALFAGCFVPQKRSRGVPSFTAAPKNSAHLSRIWVVRTVSANGAIFIAAWGNAPGSWSEKFNSAESLGLFRGIGILPMYSNFTGWPPARRSLRLGEKPVPQVAPGLHEPAPLA